MLCAEHVRQLEGESPEDRSRCSRILVPPAIRSKRGKQLSLPAGRIHSPRELLEQSVGSCGAAGSSSESRKSRRTIGVSTTRMAEELTHYLRGWPSYSQIVKCLPCRKVWKLAYRVTGRILPLLRLAPDSPAIGSLVTPPVRWCGRGGVVRLPLSRFSLAR